MDIKDLRIMVIGAHPDDADLNFGGTAIKYARAGARVRFVSVCNGSKGHRVLSEEELAARRYGEMQRSAATLGIEKYETLGCPDCELEPTLEWRKALTRTIRRFSPHLIFTHRTCDYHADHRAVGQLVMDATYFLVVPHWCPEVPEPSVYPAVFFLRDKFTVPRELRPDVTVDITDVATQTLDALACHESQFFEWLPPEIPGCVEANPGIAGSQEEKREFISRYWFAGHKEYDMKRFGLPYKYGEVFEMSEYGAQLTVTQLREMFPSEATIPERAISEYKC
ncbi:MAG: PIG-L family deacetylase [Kiritimatiellae bacterium]|nr:PIG-L family deacetylase [Kiritimatiellia bacterium]